MVTWIDYEWTPWPSHGVSMYPLSFLQSDRMQDFLVNKVDALLKKWLPAKTLSERRAQGFTRVNHVGEVCAQALYRGQAITTRDAGLRAELLRAADEEAQHLRWCEDRLEKLSAKPSRFNPVWYSAAFGLGLLAGAMGRAWGLGFVQETEKQVAAHLEDQLSQWPKEDAEGFAVAASMRDDEIAHAQWAAEEGARALPLPVAHMMRLAAGIMKKIAYRI